MLFTAETTQQACVPKAAAIHSRRHFAVAYQWPSRIVVFATLALYAAITQAAPRHGDVPLFDGHIHYNQDVWDVMTPENAIERLRAAGIARAFVSSTPTEGTERLFAQDPARIIPLLRPYRSPADRRTWFEDPELVVRLRQHLDTIPYRGIGEFHIFGANASTPVMAEMIDLAVEHGLFLLAHADEEAIVRIVEQTPDLTVIWAHAGFDVPVARLGELLARYPKLLIELSFRDDIAPVGKLSNDWRQLFVTQPDRFLVGMDTYIGSRWAELGELAHEARGWLAQLPPEVADRIAFQNAAELVRKDGPQIHAGNDSREAGSKPFSQNPSIALSMAVSSLAGGFLPIGGSTGFVNPSSSCSTNR